MHQLATAISRPGSGDGLRRLRLLIVAILVALAGTLDVLAATSSPDDPDYGAGPEDIGDVKVGNGRKRATRGYYFTEVEGDSVMMIVMNEIVVYPPMHFRNKKEEEFYWRTVRDVRRTLPYAKLICETLLETYEYIETFPTQEERERHLKNMEKAVFEQYKPVLKKFTKSQAKMLIKLINRETDQTSYNILKAFLGSFRAGFWQTFGRFFGVNLKSSYHPDRDRDDAIIERVATAIEQGLL